MRAFNCAVIKAYTWRHGTWDVRWLNRMRVHPAHSQWQSDFGCQVRRCSLGFPCVLNDVCISVNCIMANQLIFSTEQCLFIYDQYFLIQSVSQVWRLFDFTFFQQDSATAHIADISMCVFHDRIISWDLWPARSPDMTPCVSISGVDWKILCTRQTHALWKKNWNLISMTKLTSVEEN